MTVVFHGNRYLCMKMINYQKIRKNYLILVGIQIVFLHNTWPSTKCFANTELPSTSWTLNQKSCLSSSRSLSFFITVHKQEWLTSTLPPSPAQVTCPAMQTALIRKEKRLEMSKVALRFSPRLITSSHPGRSSSSLSNLLSLFL